MTFCLDLDLQYHCIIIGAPKASLYCFQKLVVVWLLVRIIYLLPQIIRDKFGFLRKYVQSGRTTEAAAEKFLSATVTLLQQMLKSESPVIPWTGLETYDPLFVEADARQLACQTDDVMDEDYFNGWKIVGYRRPILLSCNHCQVTIDKGKVRLEVPKQEVIV